MRTKPDPASETGFPNLHVLFAWRGGLFLSRSVCCWPLTRLMRSVLAITTKALPDAVVGAPYSQTLTATGGTPPYTWAIQSGGLPDLLTLDPNTGVLSGMPTASGSWVFSYPFDAYIAVTDSASNTIAASFTISVVPAPSTYYTPAQQTPPAESWLGPVYQFASYGDVLEMYPTPNLTCAFGALSLLDRQNGNLSRLNAERWFAINAVQGGAPNLISRVRNPWTWGVQDAIFLFLLLNPAATTTDPRPSYSTAFYDPGQGRLLDRTDWSQSATFFDFRCSWESINH